MTLKEETEEDRRWKDLPPMPMDLCDSGTNVVKVAILLKSVYRFSAIPNKILTQFFTAYERTVFSFL